MDISTWCDIGQSGAALVGALSILWGCKKWFDEKRINKSKFLQEVVSAFDKDELRAVVNALDTSGKCAELFSECETDKKARIKLESSFRYLSYICYLNRFDLLSKDEFSFFSGQIKRILGDSCVRDFLVQSVASVGGEVQECSFRYLIEYAQREDVCGGDYLQSKYEEPTGVHNQSQGMVLESKVLKSSDFSLPTAIIRINKLWHEGISESDLYDATRRWWRVNYETVQRVKIVLAVAFSEVKEVYSVGRWLPYQGSGARIDADTGRYQFEGSVAPEAMRNKYLGKSTKALFAQGDAYPVRYFGMD